MAIPDIRYGLNEDREYITNYDLTSAAHELLGGIQLDVASSKFANGHVEAEHYFTPSDDGLNQQEGFGRNIALPYEAPYRHCAQHCSAATSFSSSN